MHLSSRHPRRGAATFRGQPSPPPPRTSNTDLPRLQGPWPHRPSHSPSLRKRHALASNDSLLVPRLTRAPRLHSPQPPDCMPLMHNSPRIPCLRPGHKRTPCSTARTLTALSRARMGQHPCALRLLQCPQLRPTPGVLLLLASQARGASWCHHTLASPTALGRHLANLPPNLLPPTHCAAQSCSSCSSFTEYSRSASYALSCSA